MTFRPSGANAPSSTTPSTRKCTRARSRTRTASGPSRPSASTGSSRHQGQEHLLHRRRLDQMVRGRHAQRLLQLRRPPSRQARRPDRDHLGRRRPQGRQEDHLQAVARRRVQVRQCAQGARRQEGRPRHHLHADDPGSGGLDARLRAHRRHPLGDLRRLLAGFDRRPHRGLQVHRRRHRRRRPARRPQDSAQGQCRRGLRQSRRRHLRHRRQAHRRRRRHEGRPRRLLRRRSPRPCRPIARARR